MEFGPGGPDDEVSPALTDTARGHARMLASGLEKICALPDVEPRFPFLVGFCLLKAGEPKERTRPYFVRALDLAREARNAVYPPTARTAARVAAEVARVAWWTTDDALLESAYEVFVNYKKDAYWAEKMTFQVTQDEKKNPVALWAARLMEKKRYAELFRLVTGPAGALYPGVYDIVQRKLAVAVPPAKFVEGVLPQLATAEDHLAMAAFLIQGFRSEAAAAKHLDDAREKFRSSPALQLELARLIYRQGDVARAAAIAAAACDAAPADDAAAESLVLYASRLAAHAETQDRALAILAAHRRRMSEGRLAHWAEAYVMAGKPDEALKLYAADAERGSRPWFQLATLHLLDGQWEASLRYFNRSLRDGSLTRVWPTAEELPRLASQQEFSADQARLQILDKLGHDFFINRLLSKPVGAVAAEDDATVSRLLRQLEGEDMTARMEAREALFKLDPRTAPALKRGLSSKDEWAKQVVRDVLSEWAEPR